MIAFKELNIEDRFRHNCNIWVKTSEGSAHNISDDVYESGRSSFFPSAGVAHFESYISVEPIKGLTKFEKDRGKFKYDEWREIQAKKGVLV